MVNLLVYGGYHRDYIYTNHLTVGLSNLDNINTFPIFYDSSKNKIIKRKNHYFPPIKKIKGFLEDLIVKNNITHIINYNTNHFSAYLIDFIKKSHNLKIGAYYNDCPFSSHLAKQIYYKNQKNAFSKYDHIFVYRNEDKVKFTQEYRIENSNITVVPPSCPEEKYLNLIKSPSKYSYDFAFIGHYEQDGRLDIIRQLLRMGYKCLIIGLKWPEKDLSVLINENSKIQNKHLKYSDYLSLLSCARVNLGFISNMNNDLYTRRYFECPFSNSLFLAYESEFYKKFSQNMPNIFFYKNKVPTIDECIEALNFSKLSLHYPNEKQKKSFYKKNSIYERANLFNMFLKK